ncbi:hypothetical protein SeMB42_g03626 [Synchytrium endobioticum]|uniref:Uncharacterized protein n=1 Tax=Synchytrium endobioticum TaxID=286115 RepID=A0A507DDZ7_9FUNG|nr:hypothetical protein SeMB42_g03626 [Synchytrium endobioticum]TPX49919.1 hypothetical protein SeLEV6574_g01214 [Synchytrium endobioticum]
MAATTACSIKATAGMCLLWMVFLSASAADNSEQDQLAQQRDQQINRQTAFEEVGAYANRHELMTNGVKFDKCLKHVSRMLRTIQPIYGNLNPKLQQSDYLVVTEDLEDLKYLRILVTTEKFPWVMRDIPSQECNPDYRVKYRSYLELFKSCVQLFQKHMENVYLQLNKSYNELLQEVNSGANVVEAPDMKTILRIISNEWYIWGNDLENWTYPSRRGDFRFSLYRPTYEKCLRLIYENGYTSLLYESLMETARQSTTNHGNQNSVVTSGVAEPIASNQLLPLFTSDGYAGTSYGYTHADRPEFENIGDIVDTSLSLSSRANEPIASNQLLPLFTSDSNAGAPYGYTHADTSEFGYNSIEGTTRFAHPPTPYDPAGPSSSYAGIGTPYPPAPYDSDGPPGCPTDSSGFIKWL